MKPTEEAYSQFQYLYDYFNRELFSDELPDCIITLAASHGERSEGW